MLRGFLLILCLFISRGLAQGSGNDVIGVVKEAGKTFTAAALLPVDAQKAILSVFGATLVKSGQLECNIFGGKSACSDIPRKSSFAATCIGANKDVDCAFKSEANQLLLKDPAESLHEQIKDRSIEICKDCLDAVHNFWCGQTIPACGTFDKVYEKFLPVLHNVASGQSSVAEAIERAFPAVIKSYSLGLPCREMCDAITSSCSCGNATTFGAAFVYLDEIRRSKSAVQSSRQMSLKTAKKLFSSVWDTPLCNFFAPKATPGFLGVCEVPAVSPRSCLWCKTSRREPIAEMQIVAQIAHSVSGMMESGVSRVFNLMGGHGSKSTWTKEAPNEERKSRSMTVKVLLWLFLCLLCTALVSGAVYAYYFHILPLQDRPDRGQYLDLQSMGYRPPEL